MYFVDSLTFFEQVDPQGYGRMLVQDREDDMLAAAEDVYADLFHNVEPHGDDEFLFWPKS